MKKPVSLPYGWEPIVSTQIEQCICCKEEILSGAIAYRSTQPETRSCLCGRCFDAWVKVADQPLFWHPRYRADGRISTQEKQSRAATERELAKKQAVEV